MVECPLLTTNVSQRTEYLRSYGLKANALHSAQSVNLKTRFAASAVSCILAPLQLGSSRVVIGAVAYKPS